MIDLNQGSAPAAVLLPNGKVLIAGGSTDFWLSAEAELFDPATGTFTAASNMPDGLGWQRSTLLGDGTVFLAGGGFIRATPSYSVCCTGTVEVYDPGSDTFRSSGNTPPVGGQTATLLGDGTVLLTGGWQSYPQTALASSQIYHPPALVPAQVLFSLSNDGQGAILHAATQQVVSADNPAVAGEALEIYGAGLMDGSVIPPQVSIGGRMAEVLYFGKAPGFAGLNQVNVRLPAGVTAGLAGVTMSYLGRASNEVKIGVR
jgi:hypothetical protein